MKYIVFLFCWISLLADDCHLSAQQSSSDTLRPMVLSKGHSIFRGNSTTGIVNSTGEIICSFPSDPLSSPRYTLEESHLEGFVYLFTESHVGLFDIPQKKTSIAPIYDRAKRYQLDYENSRRGSLPMQLKTNCAIGHRNGFFYLIDPITGKESEAYLDVYPMNNGFYFVRKKEGTGAVIHGANSTSSIFPLNCLDAYANHFIGEVNGRCGLFSAEGEVAIPLEYEDIYFISPDAVWLKRGGKWALSNFSHQLLSDFVFTDIEKTDSLLTECFLQVTGLEANISVLYTKFDTTNNNRTDIRFDRMVHGLQQLQGSKRLYTTLFEEPIAAKLLLATSEKGVHLIPFPFRNADSEPFEKVFYIPSFYGGNDWFATQKNGQVGQQEVGWKYDSVVYDPPLEATTCSSALWKRKNKFYSFIYSEKKKRCILQRFHPERIP